MPPRMPPQHPVPSQRDPRLPRFDGAPIPVPRRPGHIVPGAPPSFGYIVNAWADAKPPNAVEFQTATGQHANDTESGSPFVSAFYTVPAGYNVLVRAWTIDAIGEITPDAEPTPLEIVTSDGFSQLGARLDFYVDGAGQAGSTGIFSRLTPFGQVDGQIYVIGLQNQTIEMRLTAVSGTIPPTAPGDYAYGWTWAELSFGGTMFVSEDVGAEAVPLARTPVPVYQYGAPK